MRTEERKERGGESEIEGRGMKGQQRKKAEIGKRRLLWESSARDEAV